MDLKSYKKKLDTTIESFKLQINNIIESNKEFTIRKVNESENQIYDNFKIYEERLQNIRIENAKFIIESKKQYENLLKEWEKIIELKMKFLLNLIIKW
jgi:hypothetical protein